MRYPAAHRETVRARIVEAASHALRRGGIDGVSVAALMKQVGLTHGGFYGYFSDRDELVAEAVRFAAAATATGTLEASSVGAMLRKYASAEHVARPAEGCVLAALGSEARRHSGPIRKSFADSARGFLQCIQRRLQPSRPDRRVSDEALDLATRMIGAVVLARLVDDEPLAKRILAAARKHASGAT